MPPPRPRARRLTFARSSSGCVERSATSGGTVTREGGRAHHYFYTTCLNRTNLLITPLHATTRPAARDGTGDIGVFQCCNCLITCSKPWIGLVGAIRTYHTRECSADARVDLLDLHMWCLVLQLGTGGPKMVGT